MTLNRHVEQNRPALRSGAGRRREPMAMAALRSMSGAGVGDVSGSAKAVIGMSRHAAIENSRASRSVGRVIGGEYHWAGRGPSELLGRPSYE